MNSDELKAKLTHYYNERENLRAADIDAKVDAKLEEMRDEVRTKVEAEIKADIDKCTYYIELLDMLVKEQCDKEDEIAAEGMAEPVLEEKEAIEETEHVVLEAETEAMPEMPEMPTEVESVPTSIEGNINI